MTDPAQQGPARPDTKEIFTIQEDGTVVLQPNLPPEALCGIIQFLAGEYYKHVMVPKQIAKKHEAAAKAQQNGQHTTQPKANP